MLTNLSVGQIAFIIVVPTVVVIAVVFIVLFLFRRKNIKTDFKEFYYKRIYKIVMDNDYYLINNFLFKIDDSHVGRIDHVIFGDKYIYIITDAFFDGDIDGKENDKSIIFIDNKGKKYYADNPILSNAKLVNKLSLITGISPSMFIGITLINDNCQCGIETTSNSLFIIQSKKLKRLIAAIESRDISDINKEQLAKAVMAFDKINRRKRRSEK